MTGSVILGGARTPFGKLAGALASFSATDLGAMAISGALARTGVAPEQVDHVLMGHVLLAGEGQSAAKNAASKAGLPQSVPAATINKVCLSGMQAVHLADLMVRGGDGEVIVAGGMESMSNAPYLLPKARSGYRYGHGELVDSLLHDGLFCALDCVLMGESTESYAASAQIARNPQDAFAAESHARAARAAKDGLFADEIVPIEVPQRRGDPLTVSADEGVRADTTADSLAKLRPAFAEAGNITAGNASQISDGASAMVVASAAAAERLGVAPAAEILAYGQVAGPDNASLLHQPSQAILQALNKIDLTPADVDLFEINEAFAAVGVASADELGVDQSVVNVNGGAIALGHPLGASGNRITLTLINELHRRGGGIGVAGLCGGGGQGDAIVVRVTP